MFIATTNIALMCSKPFSFDTAKQEWIKEANMGDKKVLLHCGVKYSCKKFFMQPQRDRCALLSFFEE
jgi:hypothetical protein